MSLLRFNLRTGAALSIVLSALAAAPAVAQSEDLNAPQETSTTNSGQEIIVTGSRIRRNPLDQPSPVVTVDSEAIARTGLSSVADVLQRLPGSAGGLNTRFNNSGNLGNPPDGGGVGAGSSTIDLRYLGAKRTSCWSMGCAMFRAHRPAASLMPSTSTPSPKG